VAGKKERDNHSFFISSETLFPLSHFVLHDCIPLPLFRYRLHQTVKMSEITEQTRQYLANCSPEDLKAMLSAIYKRSRDLAPQQGSTQNAKVTKLKNIKKARIAKESTGAAKRPLNSWMGFRSE